MAKPDTNWREIIDTHPAADAFPMMEGAALTELENSIRKSGIRQPLVFSGGKLLDGRNRIQAAVRVWGPVTGVEGEKVVFGENSVKFTTEDGDPYEAVMRLNVHRRHLDRKQKADVVRRLLRVNPELSDRALGAKAGVDHKTVAAVRARTEATGEIPRSAKTRGADGKVRRRAPKPRGVPDRERRLLARSEKLKQLEGDGVLDEIRLLAGGARWDTLSQAQRSEAVRLLKDLIDLITATVH